MKQIIDGKMYNTETAELLEEYFNDLPRGDFHCIDEALYRTKKGAFFLAGHGGALTKYAQPCGNCGTCGGDGIFPLSEAEAREWMEQHSTAEKYEETFGPAEEA